MFAQPGAVGLETAFGATLDGLQGDMTSTIRALAVGPAKVVGERAALDADSTADLVVFDPSVSSMVDEPFRSRGLNEPLRGRELPGKIVMTIRDGCIIYGPKPD